MSPIKTKRQECLIYTRVVGWITPTSRWNKGKKSEFVDRKTFKIEQNSSN
jgi:anaerobic ribonucleoside-triphosphate reductase